MKKQTSKMTWLNLLILCLRTAASWLQLGFHFYFVFIEQISQILTHLYALPLRITCLTQLRFI